MEKGGKEREKMGKRENGTDVSMFIACLHIVRLK